MRSSSCASFFESPPNKSSMSWAVPTGPLMPRNGYLASKSSSLAIAINSSSAAEANRLPSVVVCAATLWLRPVRATSEYLTASSANFAAVATALIRMKYAASTI